MKYVRAPWVEWGWLSELMCLSRFTAHEITSGPRPSTHDTSISDSLPSITAITCVLRPHCWLSTPNASWYSYLNPFSTSKKHRYICNNNYSNKKYYISSTNLLSLILCVEVSWYRPVQDTFQSKMWVRRRLISFLSIYEFGVRCILLFWGLWWCAGDYECLRPNHGKLFLYVKFFPICQEASRNVSLGPDSQESSLMHKY